jgi:hypothetical protein
MFYPSPVNIPEIFYDVEHGTYRYEDGILYARNEEYGYFPFPEDITYNNYYLKKDTNRKYAINFENDGAYVEDYIGTPLSPSAEIRRNIKKFQKNDIEITFFNKGNWRTFIRQYTFVRKEWKKIFKGSIAHVEKETYITENIFRYMKEEDVRAFTFTINKVPVAYNVEFDFQGVSQAYETKALWKFEDLNLHGINDYLYFYRFEHPFRKYINYSISDKTLGTFKQKFTLFRLPFYWIENVKPKVQVKKARKINVVMR